MIKKMFLYLLFIAFTVSVTACESKNESNSENEFENTSNMESGVINPGYQKRLILRCLQ
jgi:hypothetical protein